MRGFRKALISNLPNPCYSFRARCYRLPVTGAARDGATS